MLPLPITYQHSYSPARAKLPSLSFISGPPLKSLLRRTSRWAPPRMESSSLSPAPPRKDKILVLMGATGSGKSRLSIDLATLFPSEIINSDKMQVYNGLDITTNKISITERRNVPHHFLGEIDPGEGEFGASDFRSLAGFAISGIVSRGKLPQLVGGSNSFVHALIVDQFNPDDDVFTGSNLNSISTEFRYDCCFVWVDVSFPVLCDYLAKRVDDMLDSGMFEELAQFYNPARIKTPTEIGLRKAIGVPEFDRYFSKYPPMTEHKEENDWEWCRARREAYEEAVREIKENTYQLVTRQLKKIERLRSAGWDLHRVDATEAFKEVLMMTSDKSNKQSTMPKNQKNKKSSRWMEIWNKDVLQPTVELVRPFLEEEGRDVVF